MRFPGSPPQVWEGVPARNPAFTGREEVLLAIHGQFAGADGSQPKHVQVLSGLAGVGKTQAAAEYAFRFSSSYDAVCWVGCDQVGLARSDLARLADGLGLPHVPGREPAAEDVVDALRRGQPYRRWLLVFDNADRPEDVTPLIPDGPGHVLVTTRNPRWGRAHVPTEMVPFSRAESVALLVRRAQAIDEESADKLAEALGDLPLAIEHAAAWCAETGMSVGHYLELLAAQPGRVLLEGEVTNYPHPVARVWTLSMQRLRERNRDAATLVELCAFLGPEPVSLDLFDGPAVQPVDNAADQRLRDRIRLAKAVRDVSESAIAQLDPHGRRIQMHRLVQAVIRDDVAGTARPGIEARVHALLAAADPGNPDEPESWSRYALLRPHVLPSGIVGSREPTACQLVQNQVRYLYRRGDFWGARDLADAALPAWRASLGDDDLRTLELALDLADSLRSLGEPSLARVVDEQARRQLLNLVGRDHRMALRAASALGGDLRGLGEYDSSRTLDEDTYNRFRATLGPDHFETVQALNNLAVSLRFVGDFGLALETSFGAFEGMRRLVGDNALYTLQYADSHARDLREWGLFATSVDLATDTFTRYCEVTHETHPEALRALKNLAVSQRRAGYTESAGETSRKAFRLFRDNIGFEYPETLAAAVNLVNDLCSSGYATNALQLAEDTHKRAVEKLGDRSVYTLAAANALVVAVRLSGDPQRAAALGEVTATAFESALLPDHPFTLASRVNLANCLYDLGRVGAARDIDQDVSQRLERRLRADHPLTVSALANFASDMASLHEAHTARALQDSAVAVLVEEVGSTHPLVAAVRSGRRIDLEIDPVPP